ncbi:MAG: FAD-dependent thymidylate synthase [Candidatus Omnitrophica bacterium]|nr:FAD-dependent thymidylate synthase [Candidatus Omnitrophota bacterium]
MTTLIEKKFLSEEPVVLLENYFQDAYDNAVATARTCYSSKVVSSEEVSKDEKAKERRDTIAQSIYKAGHHTTLQHATFQFVLDKVSRQFLWSFLHSHPFYNSEQVSQRYVEVKPEHFTVPPLEEKAERLYRETIVFQMEAYHKLLEILQPTTKREYVKLFPHRDPVEKKWASAIKKKELEVARYVLPVATHAHLYHTVSGITLHRYHRLCEQFDTPLESRIVVDKMIQAVNEVDPEFFKFIEEVIPLEKTPEHQFFQSIQNTERDWTGEVFLKEFDVELGSYTSKLIDYKLNAEQTMAQAVRSVLGMRKVWMKDEEAIDLVMNPKKDSYLAQSLTLTTLGKLTRTMVHPHFTFKKKLSHTADSQDQRHRMVPASRPILARHFIPAKPDYIVPVLIQMNEEALSYYHEVMQRIWKAIEGLLTMGIKDEFALYLLPNAFPIRFEESGDLLNFHHKWVQRLCYTAQEEIWKTCHDEVTQVKTIFPNIGKYLAAPCWVRKEAGVQPFCPEGERYCGVPVWKLDLQAYDRVI